MFAYASQRLIPAIQQIYSATTAIRASQDSIVEIFNLIEDFHIKDNRISKGIAYKSYFKKNIQLENISFSYKLKSYFSLKNISLSLEKGKITGITGPSGSGKSTLIDIILGLLQPSSGVIKIDGKVLGSSVLLDFQSKISHVPQSIFLTDSSVAENIAFGIPKSKINKNLLIDCSKRAQLYELIKKLPSGFDTFVGERGIKLSGGQKQRIAIARALYKKSEFIIFDEATSALDILSEENIMKTIYKLKNDITILIIAHRLSTLRKCNKIYELKKGRISRVLNYKNLVKSI
jgi:ATP-binding cassette subfamily B protein